MEEYILVLTVFVTALIILCLAIYSQLNPPKTKNNYYGYRTKRSMKSQASWDLAQKIAPIEMKKSGIALLFLSLIVFFLDAKNEWINYAVIALMLLIILFPMYLVEKRLKKQFS